MLLYNYLFLLTFFVYFSFLLFRVIGERSPVSALWFTGFIITLFFVIKFFGFILSFFNKSNQTAKKTSFFFRIGVKIAFFVSKINRKIEIDFLQAFLNEKFLLSWIFFALMKIYENLVFKINFCLFIVIILPWLLSLIVFFLEITLFPNCYSFFFFTLYCFSLKFLLSQLLKVFLLVVQMKFNNFSENVFNRNLPLFSTDLKDFFMVNVMVENHFFYNEPSLQNKKMICFLWNLFSELQYIRSTRLSIVFFRHLAECLNKFCYNVNILIFSISFFYLSFDLIVLPDVLKSILLSDLFCCTITFFSIFLIFNFFLDFLHKSINHGEKHEYNNFHDCYNNLSLWFLSQKKKLLFRYSFLKNEDLLDFDLFIDKLSAEEHNLAFFSESSSTFLTLTERENFEKVLLGIIKWFEYNLKIGKINLDTHSFENN